MTFEVPDADIWVGEAPPTGAQSDDFWFDTTKVPLFGIDIGGTITHPGPPTEADDADPDPGDAWWDSDGNLWTWDGDVWVNQGNFRGPTGPTGPMGPSGDGSGLPPGGTTNDVLVKITDADGDAGWRPLEASWLINDLLQRVIALESAVAAMEPYVSTWAQTADWSPDGSPPLP